MKMQFCRATALIVMPLLMSACATAGSNDKIPASKISRNLFYNLQSSGAVEVHCQQKLNDLETKIVGRVLLDPSLTGVQLNILKLQNSPEMNIEAQNPGLLSENAISKVSPSDRILHALMAAHIRYYQHVVHQYLPIFYLQNPLDFTQNVAFQKTGDEYVTRYQEQDGAWIEVRIEKDGHYFKVLTSPFKGKTDMTLHFGLYENHNILQSIELTCLTPDCVGVGHSTTNLSYETIEGLPLIKKIAFNIGDGDRHENTTSIFTNLKCQILKKPL